MTRVFSVPDKEKNYKSYTVFVMTIIWSVVIGAIVSTGFIFLPQFWTRWLTFLVISLFIAVFNLTLNYKGYTRLAGWSLTIMVWLLITIPCYSSGGIMAPGILSQVSVILTAGFLLGWKEGLAIGFITICTDFGFAYLELNGQLPVPSVEHNPITRWIGAIIPFGTILSLQYYATNHLRGGLITMQAEIQKREEAEKIKDQTVHNLNERLKELQTLYTVSRVLEDEDATHEKLIREIAEILPSGWQYPESTAARVCIAETEYVTNNYKPSAFRQFVETKTASGTKVMIEVLYLEPKPVLDEGPFLKEERNLINMLAELIKTDLERRERKAELNDYKYALDISSIVSISKVDGSFLFVNENFCKISKYSLEELVGKDHSILWSGLHKQEYFEELKTTLENGKTFRGEFCNKAKDGSLYWVDSFIIPFIDEKGKVYQYLSINHDITHRINEEKRINQAVLNAQEKERLQIGMELHDNVQQILAGSALYLDFAKKNVDNKEAAVKILNDLKKFNADAITELRRLSHQLAPLVDVNTDLREKIKWLIDSLKLDGSLSISVNTDELKKVINNNIQLHLYRILQEQLSNIIKYARATAVEINIRSAGENIHFEVQDNGIGFDVTAKKQGIGLENIRRRVMMLNGEFEIVSSPGRGCKLNVRVPSAVNE